MQRCKSALLVSCLALAALLFPAGPGFEARAIVSGQIVGVSNPVSSAVVRVSVISRERRCARDGRGCRMVRVSNLCSGTVITRDSVLTAAHCLTDRGIEGVTVTFFAGHGGREIAIPARSWRPHPSFPQDAGRSGVCRITPGRRNDCFGSDVGLVRLSAALPSEARAIRRAPSGIEPETNETLTVYGYGVTDPQTRSGSGTLREGRVRFVGGRVESQALVTGGPRRSMFCIGDSGGPVVIERGGQLYLWGIMASVSSPPCRSLGSVVRLDAVGGWVDRFAEAGGPARSASAAR